MFDDLGDLMGELFDVGVSTLWLHCGRGVTDEENCQHSRCRSTTGCQEVGGTPSTAVHHGHKAYRRDDLSELAQQTGELGY